jgi:hypothetical protein
VEENMARLRFFLTTTHTEEQIRYTVDAIAQELGHVSLRQRLTLAGSEILGPDGTGQGARARLTQRFQPLLERLPPSVNQGASAVFERLKKLPRLGKR